MNYQNIKAAVFDLDGTLADTFKDVAAAGNYARGRQGKKSIPLDKVTSYIGDGMRMLAIRLLEFDPDQPNEDSVRRAIDDVREYYREHLVDQTIVYPDIPPLLKVFKDRGVRLAVLSNKSHDLTVQIVEALGLADCFDIVLGDDSRFPSKPDPAGLLFIVEKLEATPGTTLMIGDGDADYLVAKNAGSLYYGLTRGTRSEDELRALGAEPLQPDLFGLIKEFK